MSFGLDAAIRALSASRLAIQTAGQNVANAATPGYSRQRVLLGSSLPAGTAGGFQIGTGVDVEGIVNTVDQGIEMRLRMQLSASGRATVDLRRWSEIEGLFNEPNGGLSTNLTGFFGDLGALQNDAGNTGLRKGMLQSGRAMTDNLNLLADRLETLQEGTFSQVNNLVRQANEHTANIARLNRQILNLEANGSRANDLRDDRERNVKALAELIDVRAIERNDGSVAVSSSGRVLVSGSTSIDLIANRAASGNTEISARGSNQLLQPVNGQIAGYLSHQSGGASDVLTRLNSFAYDLALEMNRVHSTGVPRSGSFDSMVSFYGAQDLDGDGQRGDELLNQAGYPFPLSTGELFVSVSNKSTGSIDRTTVAINPASMTLNDFAAAVNQIPHVSATVDPAGRLRISAEQGYGFDFSTRLTTDPDSFGSFGGTAPGIGSSISGPFDLASALSSPPATFTVDIDGVPVAVDLDPSEFVNAAAVTTDELVAAINADLGSAGAARNVGERLVVRSNSSGSTATLGLTDGTGSPLAALGLPTGSTRTGQDQAVAVEISGDYTGSSNQRYLFVPDSDGTIGVTPGLTVGVFDTNGTRVATLDVGAGYSPGEPIDIVEGVRASFNSASVSATHNDVFALDNLADSDTSDILVALGLNSFFHGTTAADLHINTELERNPDLLSAGLSSSSGDADNLARMLVMREAEHSGLGERTVENFYADIVADVGFETASAEAADDAQDSLLATLQQQRDSVSGVNIDEEMIDLLKFQQAFEAASRFVSVVNEINQTLTNLGR